MTILNIHILFPVNLAGDIFLNFVLSAAVEVLKMFTRWKQPKPNLILKPDARCGGWHDRDGVHWQGLTPRHLPTHWWSQVADAWWQLRNRWWQKGAFDDNSDAVIDDNKDSLHDNNDDSCILADNFNHNKDNLNDENSHILPTGRWYAPSAVN